MPDPSQHGCHVAGSLNDAPKTKRKKPGGPEYCNRTSPRAWAPHIIGLSSGRLVPLGTPRGLIHACTATPSTRDCSNGGANGMGGGAGCGNREVGIGKRVLPGSVLVERPVYAESLQAESCGRTLSLYSAVVCLNRVQSEGRPAFLLPGGSSAVAASHVQHVAAACLQQF